MAQYPVKVELNEDNIRKLNALYKEAYKNILGEIEGATKFGVANRKQILRQIDNILVELGTDVDAFIKAELPTYYKQGADDAVAQLKEAGAKVPIKYGFNQVHKEAILALVDDTSRAFGESLTGVSRDANRLLGKVVRDQITQKLAEGNIGGKALEDVKKQIIGTIKQDGLTALVDKGGRKWELDRYTEMLVRTKAVEARNRGLANRAAQNGYDLVQVSDHLGECELCRPFEGKILSLTGATKGYMTVAEAESRGLFHPNCRHAINILTPELSDLTSAYDPDVDTVVLDEFI